MRFMSIIFTSNLSVELSSCFSSFSAKSGKQKIREVHCESTVCTALSDRCRARQWLDQGLWQWVCHWVWQISDCACNHSAEPGRSRTAAIKKVKRFTHRWMDFHWCPKLSLKDPQGSEHPHLDCLIRAPLHSSQSLASRSGVHRPPAAGLPGSLLERQYLRPHPGPTKSESAPVRDYQVSI